MSISEKTLQLKQDFDDVYEAGKKAEYDAFWDKYQQNGKRTEYFFAFGGRGWTDELFKPKYDLNMANSATQAFTYNSVTDLVKSLEDANVKLDISRVTNITNMFSWAETTRLPEISTISSSSLIQTFYSMKKLVGINKLVLRSDGTQTFSKTFDLCENLEHLSLEGTIGQNGFDIHWSTKLSASSLYSIISALSSDTTGLTITLPSTAQANFEIAYGTGTWKEHTDTRRNWTIAYE